MLNHKQLRLLFIYALTLFLFSPSYAQIDSRHVPIKICDFKTGDKADNACGPGSITGIIDIESPNEVEVTLTAYAVNIPRSSDGNDNSFPTEYPKLHLRYAYSANHFMHTKPLERWTLVDEVIANNGEVHLLYRSDQKVKVLLPEDSKCDPESSTILFPIDIRLYTFSEQNGRWEDYPINDYADPNDIFSCEVFDNTKHVCDPKVKPSDLVTIIDICVSCDNKAEVNDFEFSIQQTKVLANPFSETLNFIYVAKNAADLTITLLTMDGSTILNNFESVKEGNNKLQISTGGLSSGTYFLSVFDGEKNFVQKVVCVK